MELDKHEAAVRVTPFMKSNPLTVALVAVLAVCAVATAVLSATFTLKLRKLGAMLSQGDACDVSNKYTLAVRVNNIGNEAALIVYGCTFSVKCLVQENVCKEICA